jgi:hypothetical protein
MKLVKVEPASRFGHREGLRSDRAEIEQRGHMVASRWTRSNHDSSDLWPSCPQRSGSQGGRWYPRRTETNRAALEAADLSR